MLVWMRLGQKTSSISKVCSGRFRLVCLADCSLENPEQFNIMVDGLFA